MKADFRDSGPNRAQGSANIERANLAAAVEQAADGIVVTGMNGAIQYVNPSFTAMTGYSLEEAVGKTPRILKSGCHSAAFYKEMWNTIRSGRVWRGEITNRRKDGTTYQEETRISPARGENGEIVGYVAIKRDITERRKAEAALRESEVRFRSMADSSPSMMWVTDEDGKIQFVNRMYREFSGITCEEAQADKWRTLLHADDAPQYLAAFDKAIAEHISFSAEARMRRPDGEWRLVGSRGEPRFSLNGKYLGHIGLQADITARRKAEQLQDFQNSLIRTIYEGSLDGILVVNPDGIVVSHNKRLLDVWKIPLTEISDGEAHNIVGDRHEPLLAAVLDRVKDPETYRKRVHAVESDQDATDRSEFELKDGRTLERYSLSLRSESGQYLGHARFFRDLTDQKQAEQALRESEERFRIMADGCPIGIWMSDEEGRTRFVNRTYREFCGIASEGVDPDAWRALIHPDDRPAFVEGFERALREHTPFKTESRHRRADGAWRWVESYAVPRFSKDLKFLGLSGTSKDVTERWQAEQALKESEERFRVMADGCPLPMWVTGAEGGVQFVNRALREFTGAGKEQVEGDNWLMFSHPDDAQAFFEESRRVVRERVPFKTETRFRRADGEWRWLAIVGEPRLSSSGEFMGHIGLGMDITERKQAEQALKETEERFRVMADSCSLGIWVTDSEGKTLFANRAYRLFCGNTSEELEPDAWLFLLHPDDAPEFLETFDRAVQEHTQFRGEQRVRRADGEWRWLESTAVPRFSPGGEFLGLVGTSQDITGRKQAEQALKGSEEQFRQLAENIRQVFWLKEPEAEGFLYISPAFEQVWERPCASVYQNPAIRLEAIHPDDFERSRSDFARQMQGEEIESEYRIRTPEGREKWIRGRTFPIRDQEGKLFRIAGIAEDITERKLHEEALIRARGDAEAANSQLAAQHAVLDSERNLLRTFIDNIPDWIFVKDTDSRFIVVNREFARCAGVEKPVDLVGKSDRDIFPAEVAERIYEDDRAVIRSGRPMFNREETVGTGASRTSRILLTTKVPLLDSQGHVTGIAGMARDITKRKAMENELREGNRELQRSIDRANKLAVDAEAANRSKSEFLANMSHEIRTPMNGVIGMNGLLLSTNMDEEQRHYAEVIDACARSLLTVIDDILDFSKVEAGKLEIDTVNFNLHVLMGDFAGMMAERVGDKPLEFVCAVAPDVRENLRGDPGRLRQVLQNLVSNAMKFTHQGEVVVRVELISETDGDVRLRFAVRDTGIGIPKDKQQILFTSFTQVERLDYAAVRRHRIGACHFQETGRTHGRRNRLREQGGRRLDVLVHSPPRQTISRPPSKRPQGPCEGRADFSSGRQCHQSGGAHLATSILGCGGGGRRERSDRPGLFALCSHHRKSVPGCRAGYDDAGDGWSNVGARDSG